MADAVIELDKVWKSYSMGKAGKLDVLKDVSFRINEGEFVAITGPSGSGKSTMMNIVGALDIPSQGAVYLRNENVASMSESSLAVLRSRTIGFVFQQFNLIQTLDAFHNVMLPMEFVEKDPRESQDRAIELLDMLGLADRMRHRPSELSGGQQQRVAIARAMANDPDIILADEPTGNLDSKTGKFVMDFLGKLNLNQKKTIILVTHDMDLVKYAKRVIYLKDGIVIKDVKNGGHKR